MSRRLARRHGGGHARPAPGRSGNRQERRRDRGVTAESGEPAAPMEPSVPREAPEPVPVLIAAVAEPSDAAAVEGHAATEATAASDADLPDAGTRGCTAAQLRRFIKSRPYVPMHELRRRFELNGAADEVSPIQTSTGTVYVGLPTRESRFIADLVSQGDVGLEICRDPWVPMVVGVYAMRPISRQ